MQRKLSFLIVLLVLAVLLNAMAFGQVSTALSGTISDQNGAVVAGATVAVKHVETGVEFRATSSGNGLFTIPSLSAGTYSLKVVAQGFKQAEVRDININAGVPATVNISLEVGAASESVVVQGGAEVLQTQSASISTTITGRQITETPLTSRDALDLVLLLPGTNTPGRPRTSTINGLPKGSLNITIDGVNVQDNILKSSDGFFTYVRPRLDAVDEVTVSTATPGAESAGEGAVQIKFVTRSGTNEYTGSLYEYHRNPFLNANYWFNNRDLTPKPGFTTAPRDFIILNQFGGRFGGPIWIPKLFNGKDKAFFFGSYEQQRFRNPRQVFFDNLQNFTPTAATQEAFDFYKSLQVPFEQTNDARAGLVRFDYNFNENHRFNVRYSQSDNNALNANATGNALFPTTVSALTNNGTEKDRTYTITGQLTDYFQGNLVNELRAQYTREVRPRLANAESPNVTNGIGRFGTVNFLPTTQFDWRFQLFENLTWIMGNHTVKFGAEVNHTYADQTFAFNQFGTFNFGTNTVATLLDIMSYTPSITTGVVNRFDTTQATYLRQIGNGRLDLAVDEFSFFAQDAWRIRPNFTLNYGLRWEGQFNPSPDTSNSIVTDKVRGFRFPSGHVVDPSYIPDVANQFAPRVGIAWDPFNNSKTVVRAFGGIYYARTPMLLLAGPLNNFRNPPGDVTLTLPIPVPASNPNNTVYKQLKLIGVDLNNFTLDKLPILTTQQVQSVVAALGLANFDPFTGVGLTTWANDYKNPKSYQFGGGVERELGGGFSVSVDYSQVNTFYLQRNRDLNLPLPVLRSTTVDPAQRPFIGVRNGSNPFQARPIPSLGAIQVRESTGRSVYQSMTVGAKMRRKRVQFSAFYTLSRNLSNDDNERDAGGVLFENAFNLAPEFNYSRLDRRHQFVASPVVFLPGGFDVSSAIRLRSALPIDAGFGSDANGDLGGSDRPYSAAGVPFLRNSFRNFATYEIDLRVQKGISLGEDRRLIFSAEFFNLPNLENLQLPFGNARVTNYCAAPVPANCGFSGPTNPDFLKKKDTNGAYILTNNPGAPFQLQFGARFQF